MRYSQSRPGLGWTDGEIREQVAIQYRGPMEDDIDNVSSVGRSSWPWYITVRYLLLVRCLAADKQGPLCVVKLALVLHIPCLQHTHI